MALEANMGAAAIPLAALARNLWEWMVAHWVTELQKKIAKLQTSAAEPDCNS